MCINFHQLVKSEASTSTGIIYIVTVLYWSVAVATKLAFILLAGVRVNEKVRCVLSYCLFFYSHFYRLFILFY